MEKKPCLKCLLKEMDEAAYMEKIHRYIEMMDAKPLCRPSSFEFIWDSVYVGNSYRL